MFTHKILVIDDDLDLGMLIYETALSKGMACSVTSDAGSFMRELTPDTTLIFLDLIMPGVDGVELLRRLADKNCGAGIVVMSGVGKRVIESADALGQSVGLHIVGHLSKPFRLAELEAMLAYSVEPKGLQPLSDNEVVHFEERELIRAVERDEFVLHYQPQIEIATGRIVGVEGLVRWEHPSLGLVFPDNFIEIAEDIGLIDLLTMHVFHHGLSDISLFTTVYEMPLTLSMNVAVSSLRDLEFPNRFMEILGQHRIKPQEVILEITESGLIHEFSRTLDVMTRLRLKSVQLSIDDFGTGYSMMQQLRNVPANEMKIDKSLLQNMQTENDRVILQKTIELGHELGMKVAAEGVETREQLEFLRDRKCDVAQGYLFSKPVPSPQLIRWIEEYGRGAGF